MQLSLCVQEKPQEKLTLHHEEILTEHGRLQDPEASTQPGSPRAVHSQFTGIST